MPDITMCKGEGCTLKENCYRFTATPSEYRQAFFISSPCKQKLTGQSCEHYWDNRRYEEKEDKV